MERYRNRSGKSVVQSFEIGQDSITVQFRNEPYDYLYTTNSAGNYNIDQMKTLARSGTGLATFINRHVQKKYASKSR